MDAKTQHFHAINNSGTPCPQHQIRVSFREPTVSTISLSGDAIWVEVAHCSFSGNRTRLCGSSLDVNSNSSGHRPRLNPLIPEIYSGFEAQKERPNYVLAASSPNLLFHAGRVQPEAARSRTTPEFRVLLVPYADPPPEFPGPHQCV